MGFWSRSVLSLNGCWKSRRQGAITRQRELFKRGHITQAEYEQAYLYIDRQLQRMKPSAQAEAREIVPLLKDFRLLWQQMTLTERRAMLQAIFAGLYLDSQNHLWKVSTHKPFDGLLSCAKRESAKTLFLETSSGIYSRKTNRDYLLT